MSRLDHWLEYAESHQVRIVTGAMLLLSLIALADWRLPALSIGFLYLLPILISAVALNTLQMIGLSAFCSFLEEAFSPAPWSAGALDRLIVVAVGFAMAGFFVVELDKRRRLLGRHVNELAAEMGRRKSAESQLTTLIETSPLAILTIDSSARVVLANSAARATLEFQDGPLHGIEITPYLPILPRMLHSSSSGPPIRTNVECNATRKSGEMFLAHVWLSTYSASDGPGLAAVIWDASESLRDREDAGLDSMMFTSRVLVGAISHEIRNLASAAALSYTGLNSVEGVSGNHQFQALGSLIQALERMASSGIRLASKRDSARTDLRDLLSEARVVLEPLFREGGIRVSWKLSPRLPLVEADRQSLQQVFLNLARNAKSALTGCECRELAITASVEQELVVVRFCDTGPGVSNPQILFKPFQREAEFSGLGLFISRAILRSHGGDLRYEPQPSGSCFAVELQPKKDIPQVGFSAS